MTNAEKFEEVFGIKPDIESMVIDCPKIPPRECKYWEDAGCHCEMWWRRSPPLTTPTTSRLASVTGWRAFA